MQLSPILAVAAGSALGGAGRYLVALALTTRSAAFPLGTLAVNIAGGFALGIFVRALGQPSHPGTPTTTTWLFLTVGLCGGFTTFSAFSLDTVRLLQDGATSRAALYVAASIGLTVAAVQLGLLAGRLFARGA